MPIHDRSAVESGLFHHFHVNWISALSTALNQGVLPDGYYALAEQRMGTPIPDVLTLHAPGTVRDEPQEPDGGGIAVAVSPPRTPYVQQSDVDAYLRRENRVVVRHPCGEVVAVIEILSPGNKHSHAAFLDKAIEFLLQGVHLLLIDLFPPTPRDPQGIHGALWNEFAIEPFRLPPEKPLTLAAYDAGPVNTAYVEPVAVGDELPAMPMFLSTGRSVPVPLAETYATTWADCPRVLQTTVLTSGRN
jgi:hypothetical protein